MITEIYDSPVDLFEVPMRHMAATIFDPYSQELVEVVCNDSRDSRPRCSTVIQTTRINSPFVACDACIAAHHKKMKEDKNRVTMERVIPKRYRQTDIKHANFPNAIYQELKKLPATKSLFIHGPSGSGKTRVAMQMMKRAVIHHGMNIAVLWPERIRLLAQGFETSFFDSMAAIPMLCMDDPLLTACREPRLVDAVKNLFDARMRDDLPTIVTSQIGTEQELNEAKEFGETKKADQERIRALLRRLKEDCHPVNLNTAQPTDTAKAF